MKKQITQKCTPLLALILSWALLLSGIVPLSYFSFATAEFSAETSIPEDTREPTALYELTELRQADTKYIQMSDGTVRALVYDTAVHRPDGQGGYTEIDNRLSQNEDGIVNTNARIKFSKKITGKGTLFTLHEGNRKITLSLPGAVKKTPATVVHNGTTNKKAATKLEELSTLSKTVSSVSYRNILPQTDIEYILQGNNIKENIVVNAPKERYSYTFELELCNLTAARTSAGEITLRDGEETVYTLPAPFMYDADGKYSEAVDYTLTPSNGNGKYTLTVTADEGWLNAEERVFPVTIDPTITVACTPQTDSTIVSGSGSTVRHCFTLNQNTPAYFLLSDLPNALELPVLAAELHLYAYQYSSGLAGARLSLYSMDYSGALEDLISGAEEVPDSALHHVDTQHVNGWMHFTYNLLDTGFFLGALNGQNLYYKLTMTENEYDESLLFYSCQTTSTEQKPVLVITYGYLQSQVLDYTATNRGFFITDTYQPRFSGDYQSIRLLVTQNNSSIPALRECGDQPDARGFFYLIPGETGFKIFGTYDLNYLYVEDHEGGKVPRFGATQDEWVLVGLRNNDYLILSAEDPTQALTRTDTGVALQSLEKDNEQQSWRFYQNISSQIGDVRYIQSGIYYINNNQTKTFLTQKQDYLLGIQLEAGTEAVLGNRMAWYIGYAGDGQYMIQSLENPDYILTAGASSPMLVPQRVFDDTETFYITPSSYGGYTIKCTYTMYEDSDETETVYLGISSGSTLAHRTSTNESTSWRLCKQEDYEEMKFDSASDYSAIGHGIFPDITRSGSDAYTFSELSKDFTYSSGNAAILEFSGTTANYKRPGVVNITATHKPTGKNKTYRVWAMDAIWCFKSSGKRLSAEVSESNGQLIKTLSATNSVSSTSSGFGRQLWYTEYTGTGNYYYLHSLHVRDENMSDNTVLAYTASGNLTLQKKGTSPTNERWEILKSGKSFSLKNKNNQYLALNGNSVTLSSSAFLWQLEGVEDLYLPDCSWSGGYADGQTVHHVYIQLDNSIGTSGLISDTLRNTALYDELFGSWNNLSSNIIVHYPGTYDPSQLPTGAYVVNFKTGSFSDNKILGITMPNSGDVLSQWNSAKITLSYQFNSGQYNLETLKMTIIHELGHALKLSHTFSENNSRYYTLYLAELLDESGKGTGKYELLPLGPQNLSKYHIEPAFQNQVLSAMNYNAIKIVNNTIISTSVSFGTLIPTFLDKFNLIRKWGM